MSGAVALPRAKVSILMVALVLTVLSYQLNATMISPLLVVIAGDLRADTGDVSAVMSVFFAASAVGGMVIARWSDTVGLRRALLVVLFLLAGGTAVCALAPSLPFLIAGRALQGLGSAVFPLGTLVIRAYLPARAFGPAIGIIAACNGGVLGFDSVLSGVLEQHFGFHAVFWFLLGLTVIAAALLAVSLPGRPGKSTSMDWRGAAAASIVVIAIFQVVSEATDGSARGLLVWVAILVAGVLAVWLLQRGRPDALVSLSAARSRTFWPVLVVTFFSLAALVPLATYSLVMLAQDTGAGFGLTPTLAAVWFLVPYALGGVVVAPIGGWLGARFGWIPVLRVGLVLGVIAAGTLALAPPTKAVAVGAAVLTGIAANGLAVACVNSLSVFQSPPSAPAQLPALNSAAFGIGISTGIALVAPHVAEGTAPGFRTAFLISGTLALLAFGATFLVKRVVPAVSGRTRSVIAELRGEGAA